MQLTESALATPALVSRTTVPSSFRKDLERTLEAVRQMSTLSVYQQRERSQALEHATSRLSVLLMSLIDERI
jgi:hypothetical protein